MVIPTNYNFHYSWRSWLKTAFFTTVFALLHATLLNAQNCTADAGTLSSIEICFQRTQVKLNAIPQGDTVVPSGYRVLYVLTRGDDLVVEAISDDPSFTIDQTDNGLFTIHTLVYDSTTLKLDSILIGRTTGFEVADLLIQSGGTICGSIDTVGARVRFGACESDSCSADAGRLAVANTSDSCFANGSARLVARVQTAPVVPAGYSVIYVLTSGSNLVIQQVNDSLSFNVDTTGRYTIHTLVYDTATLDLDSIVIGQTTGAFVDSLFIQGGGSICGSLDVRGAVFNLTACDTTTTDTCAARAGTLTAASAAACLAADSTVTLTARVATAPTVPTGYLVRYVLTSGNNLVIQNVATTPSFTVDTIGSFRIHALVYDSATLNLGTVVPGQTTGAQVNSLLVQGGGTICAALDLNGASFTVAACDTTGVDSTCNISAGRLTFNGGNFCIDSTGSTTLTARVQTAPTAPTGYSVVYVLTSGDSLVIEQAGATPSFDVDTTGRFTIHTLVYDSTTLNLRTIVFGTTTGVDVIELLTQGGGEICGALDATGVRFDVTRCVTNPDSCVATSGVLRIANEDYCLGDSTATLEVTVQTAPNLPNNYVLLYVLTATDSLIIEAVDTIPSFDVDTTGRFRIHAFVFDSTEVNLADTNLVRLGETSALTLLPLLVQGGGTICAVLDATGVVFDVAACDSTNVDSCAARAGTVSIADSSFCFRDSSATLTAAVQTAATIPTGYQQIFVLTSTDSLIIKQVSATPSFTVDTTGRYRIHSLVYDTSTLDLGIVEFGETTGFNVNSLLIQGGGTICAALDVNGVIFDVVACDTTGVDCTAEVGILSVNGGGFCRDSTGSVTLTGVVVTPATVPTGYSLLYVLTSGDSLVIEDVNATPSFTVDTTGRFTIHTLVYDSTTLDLDSVVIGTTTGADVNALLVQGGGEICGALDVAGLQFNVRNCSDFNDTCLVSAGALRVVNEDYCLGDSTATLTAAIQSVPNFGPRYQILYVLTATDSLVIEAVDTIPSFTVDTTGRFRIHILVYDTSTLDLGIVEFGRTTGFDVNRLLIQGGGTICAALDVNGAIFDVATCADSCQATAGTVRIANTDFCFQDSSATLTAAVQTAATIPTGYQRIFVLTATDSLVIKQVSATPSFTVDTTGRYRIHPLVYDSTTLDLSIVQFDTTTAAAVNALLIQGGGDICAALDVNGVLFDVTACSDTTNVNCDTTLFAGSFNRAVKGICVDNNFEATLVPIRALEPVVAAGYQVIYLLASGSSNLVIEEISDTASFTVNTTGRFTILTFVYNPNAFDLGSIELGETTVDELESQLLSEGGSVCGALDVLGARFEVRDCACGAIPAVLGYTAPGSSTVCISPDFTQFMSGNIIRRSIVPTGYQVIYLLTSGSNRVIEAVANLPVFGTRTPGTYYIHTLVYDPATLDLDQIEFGVTTIAQINALLRQGGGTICAGLETNGLRFTAKFCTETGLTGSTNLYPNPANEYTVIELPTAENVERITIKLVDYNGTTLKEWKLQGGTESANLDLSSVQPGSYFVRVMYDNEITAQQPIVKIR